MKIVKTNIPDIIFIEPKVFGDNRGFFFESFNQKRFDELIGSRATFVQDNHSKSRKNVLRGLHYQIRQPQGKLVRVIRGEIFDVSLDIRRSSPTFGKWVSVYLSGENMRQVWVPEGFAHGFLVLSDAAECLYKTTDFYAPENERCIRWDDPDLNIKWPLSGSPQLSDKDAKGVSLRDAEVYE